MSDDKLFRRIKIVSDYYRGAVYQMLYDSEDGGYWSYKLTVPPPPAEEVEEVQEFDPTQMINAIRGVRQPDPVFGMRCAELSVIAEALEHWHATVLARSGPQNPEEGLIP